jgi:hypothetical protein
MRRWQHKVVIEKVMAAAMSTDSVEDTEREKTLDSYGRDGWELVSVVLQSYRRESDPIVAYNYMFCRYYFKREVQESK